MDGNQIRPVRDENNLPETTIDYRSIFSTGRFTFDDDIDDSEPEATDSEGVDTIKYEAVID